MKMLRTLVMGLSILAVLMSPGMTAASQEASPVPGEITIVPPDEMYADASLGEWSARWWQWALSFPVDVNPNLDPTGGERCGYGQSGPVFFLAVNFTGEPQMPTCVVPEGTAIYFFFVSGECSTLESPPSFGRDEDELRACAEAGFDGVTISSVTINGHEIPDPESHRFTSPLFTFTLPENNLIGVTPGVGQSVSAGYGAIISPPEAGEYEIVATMEFEGVPEPFVAEGLVIVEAPHMIEPDASPVATPAT